MASTFGIILSAYGTLMGFKMCHERMNHGLHCSTQTLKTAKFFQTKQTNSLFFKSFPLVQNFNAYKLNIGQPDLFTANAADGTEQA